MCCVTQMLFKKNLFVMAINLAKSQHLDNDGLSEIFRHYGDHLYTKGDHDGAIQQYIRQVCSSDFCLYISCKTVNKKAVSHAYIMTFLSTIGKLEPSYVIRNFLDAQRIHNLTAYLQALHRQSLANADHTTLLLNCYTKLKDSSKLEEFIKVCRKEITFALNVHLGFLNKALATNNAFYTLHPSSECRAMKVRCISMLKSPSRCYVRPVITVTPCFWQRDTCTMNGI